jgi:gluconolactonase
MQKKWKVLLSIFALSIAAVRGQSQNVGEILRTSPELDHIVSLSAKIEKLADSFGFVEGPVWVHSGYLLFSDIPRNVILKRTQDGTVSIFLHKSGFAGHITRPIPQVIPLDHLTDYLIGSNGLTLDHEGRLIICEHGNRRVERLEANGRRTILADRFEGKRLNSPNDVVVKSDGSIYFTDPPFGLPKLDQDPQKELPFNGVYRLAGGKLEVLAKDMGAPNGLAFTPDEKYLYVDDSGKKDILRYEVQADGSLANPRLFLDLSTTGIEGVPDGLKVDISGNLYCAGPDGIWVISPDGRKLGVIKLPEVPANFNWGGSDAKTLYMTARTGLYSIRLNIPGVRP